MIEWDKYFYYDTTSPTYLRWKITYHTKKPDDVAGCFSKRENGKPKRAQVQLKGKTVPVHLIIWEIHNGQLGIDKVVDHLDRNPWNNLITNLSPKSTTENSRNRSKSTNNKSGITGVSKCSRPRFAVSWNDLQGKARVKYFPFRKYDSEILAWEAAILFREITLKELNNNGAGYTNDHGK